MIPQDLQWSSSRIRWQAIPWLCLTSSPNIALPPLIITSVVNAYSSYFVLISCPLFKSPPFIWVSTLTLISSPQAHPSFSLLVFGLQTHSSYDQSHTSTTTSIFLMPTVFQVPVLIPPLVCWPFGLSRSLFPLFPYQSTYLLISSLPPKYKLWEGRMSTHCHIPSPWHSA